LIILIDSTLIDFSYHSVAVTNWAIQKFFFYYFHCHSNNYQCVF